MKKSNVNQRSKTRFIAVQQLNNNTVQVKVQNKNSHRVPRKTEVMICTFAALKRGILEVKTKYKDSF